ncbi:MAG: M20/M25/M40 family metallo-hydrolase [Deltaproteobacteria bacterium]|nr:M20/M25/M40 family metallo-hydrolase [Deltaproteobacteria bacterium]
MDRAALAEEGLEHFVKLLTFNTSNPPGNETPAARYLAEVLEREGLDPVVIESAPGRGNVVARLEGDGSDAPLLLFGHLDVVPAEPEHWEADPFAAEIRDGYLYGRGAVDMKNMVAMSLATILWLKRNAHSLRRDVIFAAVADEECGGKMGAGFLVDHHPDLLRAEHALCEVGGFRIDIMGRSYFPVQVAERGAAWCRARFRGQPGHGSVPDPDSAIHRLARGLVRLERKGLPLHATETVRHFVETVAARQRLHVRMALKALLNPLTSGKAMAVMDDEQARLFNAQLHNTATPTSIRGGEKINVIPSSAEVDLDGRVLPGQTWESFQAELQKVLGEEAEIELVDWMEPLVYSYDTPLFDTIRRVITEREPDAEVVPYLLTGLTDAKHLDRLGIVTYGFSPMNNDPGEKIARLAHGHNERIGVDAFKWGLDVLCEVVERYCKAPAAHKAVGSLMDEVLGPVSPQPEIAPGPATPLGPDPDAPSRIEREAVSAPLGPAAESEPLEPDEASAGKDEDDQEPQG